MSNLNLLLHPSTQQQTSAFLDEPSHALILVGPAGSGKLSLALQLSGQLLGIDTSAVSDYAYVKIIRPLEGKAIGIEAVRELEHFLSLKVPGRQRFNRVVVIENSHLLGVEAQNALLKTLEEPPTGTLLILTTAHQQSLLATIRSRSQQIVVNRPEIRALSTYFSKQGFDASAIQQALAISGGLPGLTQSLLGNTDHPLLLATIRAR